MSSIDLSSFKGLYVQTSREYIVKLKHALKALRIDPQNPDAINEAHIAAHSLTTQAALTGNKNVEGLNVSIEKIFKKLKEEKSKVPSQLLPLLEEAVKSLSDCIDSIQNSDKEIDLSDITSKIDKA